MSEVLGIIAARGGSKRIPRKNLKKIDGRPMIAFSIEHANKSDQVDKAIVSTDDEEIKETALDHGGSVPFNRPTELASDTATTNEVVLHALDWFKDQGETFDIVCTIPVTTPFRETKDVSGTIKRLKEHDVDSVVAVTEFDPPPFWAVDTDDEGLLYPYFGDDYLWDKTRTQEVPTLLRPNGAVYAATVDAFRKYESFYTERTGKYVMPRERSFDIDEPIDLEIARAITEGER